MGKNLAETAAEVGAVERSAKAAAASTEKVLQNGQLTVTQLARRATEDAERLLTVTGQADQRRNLNVVNLASATTDQQVSTDQSTASREATDLSAERSDFRSS